MIVSTTLTASNADLIGDALASVVAHVDRCLVIDTGARDDTLEVARRVAGEKLLLREFPWRDDFAAARNFALDAAAEAGGHWAVTLDTDERLVFEPGFDGHPADQVDLAERESRFAAAQVELQPGEPAPAGPSDQDESHGHEQRYADQDDCQGHIFSIIIVKSPSEVQSGGRETVPLGAHGFLGEALLLFLVLFLPGYLAQPGGASVSQVDTVRAMLQSVILGVPQVLLILHLLRLQPEVPLEHFGLYRPRVRDALRAFRSRVRSPACSAEACCCRSCRSCARMRATSSSKSNGLGR